MRSPEKCWCNQPPRRPYFFPQAPEGSRVSAEGVRGAIGRRLRTTRPLRKLTRLQSLCGTRQLLSAHQGGGRVLCRSFHSFSHPCSDLEVFSPSYPGCHDETLPGPGILIQVLLSSSKSVELLLLCLLTLPLDLVETETNMRNLSQEPPVLGTCA